MMFLKRKSMNWPFKIACLRKLMQQNSRQPLSSDFPAWSLKIKISTSWPLNLWIITRSCICEKDVPWRKNLGRRKWRFINILTLIPMWRKLGFISIKLQAISLFQEPFRVKTKPNQSKLCLRPILFASPTTLPVPSMPLSLHNQKQYSALACKSSTSPLRLPRMWLQLVKTWLIG